MIRRLLLLSAFVIFSSIIVETSRSLAATNDPASVVGDLGSRAIASMQSGDTAAAKQERFRQLLRQYFDVEACARFALGTYWRTATTLQRQEFVELYEDYVVVSSEMTAPSPRMVEAGSTPVGYLEQDRDENDC